MAVVVDGYFSVMQMALQGNNYMRLAFALSVQQFADFCKPALEFLQLRGSQLHLPAGKGDLHMIRSNSILPLGAFLRRGGAEPRRKTLRKIKFFSAFFSASPRLRVKVLIAHSSLMRRRNLHVFPVLGHCAAGDIDALGLQE